MAVLDIKNFGGELPSVSPRALPADAAQENRNLLLLTREFRPLKADTTVSACPAGTKTLRRFARKADGSFNTDTTTGWITSTQERSYVKGQINDERTERTYYTVDDGSVRPRAIDVNGADRVLGVPRPTKTTVSLDVVEEFTPEEADSFLYEQVGAQVRSVIQANIVQIEPLGRRSGSTMYAGPTSTYGMTFSNNATVVAEGFGERHADLWYVLPQARADEIKISDSLVNGKRLSNGDWLVSITAIPWTARVNAGALVTALQGVTFPSEAGPSVAGQPVFTADQVNAMVTKVQEYLSPDRLVRSQKQRLNSAVGDFMSALLETPINNADQNDDDIWALHRKLGELRVLAYNLTVDVENVMRDALKRLTDSASTEIQSYLSSAGGVTGLGVDVVNRQVDTRFYFTTFVTDWGEESEPSEVSDMIEMDQNDIVTVARPGLSYGTDFAARNIEKFFIRRRTHHAHKTVFPKAVDASRHDIVHQVIAVGNRVKNANHAARFFGGVDLVIAEPAGFFVFVRRCGFFGHAAALFCAL